MISFDFLTLNALVNEQKTFFTDSRVNKIQQPTRREFIFSLRNTAQNRQLYVNIDPRFYHICFMSEENSQKRMLKIPQKPPMFCMLLRKYIENSKIIKVNIPDNERILELYFEANNFVGDSVCYCLAIELMGKHSNIILYDAYSRIIIGCAHNVGADKSRLREVYGGIPYIYPPQKSGSNFKSLIIELKNEKSSSVNDIVDNYYSYYIHENKLNELKTKYSTMIARNLKKVSKSLSQMENKLNSGIGYDRYRHYGDLLISNIYQLEDYSKNVQVFDYENDKNVVIELDELKTIKENVANFYKKYNKAKNANLKLREFINSKTEEKIYLEQLLYFIQNANNFEDLQEIETELGINKVPQKEYKNKNIEIFNIKIDDNTIIYVGKNNKQNDYIISKLSNDDDLWFHVHNNAGSHVLLKSINPTDELILKCAKLAKEYSSVKNSSKIGVIYTKRKYIRKPPSSAPGYVTYKNEKEIIID